MAIEVVLKDMVVEFRLKVCRERFLNQSQVTFKLLMHRSFEGSALKGGVLSYSRNMIIM